MNFCCLARQHPRPFKSHAAYNSDNCQTRLQIPILQKKEKRKNTRHNNNKTNRVNVCTRVNNYVASMRVRDKNFDVLFSLFFFYIMLSHCT